MKIVLYVNSFLPDIGGREVVVHYLASELKKMGHEVRVVGAAGWWKHRKLRFSYPVHRFPVLRGRFSQQVRFLQLLFDVIVFGADVINAHATYPAGFLATKIKNLKNIPVVVTPHGGDILAVPEIGYGDRLNPEINRKIESSLKSADAVTAISSTIRDVAFKVVDSPEKVTIIANGIDNKRLERQVSADVLQWLNVPPDSRLIMTVGNYHPCKGQENIVRAMKQLLDKNPDVVLVVVGRNTEALVPLINELRLRENVFLTGGISFPFQKHHKQEVSPVSTDTDWLAAIYQQAEIYVSAGVNDGAEGLSLAVLDAMAAGLPIVGTNISGNKDVVSNNVNGILVPPDDVESLAQSTGKLLENDVLRQQMGEKSREHAQQYFWSNIARQYESVYQKVCGKVGHGEN